MPIQVTSFASQAQAAYTNPFQQRVEDQDRRSEQRQTDLARTETRSQGASAAESQRTALAQQNADQNTTRQREEEPEQSTRGQQRGGLVDLSV